MQYACRQQRFILDGDQNELQRIKRELKNLVQKPSDESRILKDSNLYHTPPRPMADNGNQFLIQKRGYASFPNQDYMRTKYQQHETSSFHFTH